jgi:Protein of unknown function (DUF1761)
MPEVNYVAVLVAALASFLVGAVWYSPVLFANSWMAENGKTMASVKGASPPMAQLYATAFVTALIAALAMAGLLVTMQHHGLETGIKRGFAAGVCWVAMCFGSSYAFEGKSLRHWAINAGYYVVQFTVMGAILGVMNH